MFQDFCFCHFHPVLKLSLAILLGKFFWWQIVFLHLRISWFMSSFLKNIVSLDMEFWTDNSFLSALEKCCTTTFCPPLFFMGNLLLFKLFFLCRKDVVSLLPLSQFIFVFNFQMFDFDVSWYWFLWVHTLVFTQFPKSVVLWLLPNLENFQPFFFQIFSSTFFSLFLAF